MKRIQRKRVHGWRMPPNTIYVGRPSKYGNPYALHGGKQYERTIAIEFYEKYMKEKLLRDPHFLDGLKGKDLACWCPLDKKCHADVLLSMIKESKS